MINVPGVSEDTDPMIQGPHVFFLRETTIAFSSFVSPPFWNHEFWTSRKSRNEALSPAMSLPDWLGHGYANIGENAPKVLATGLNSGENLSVLEWGHHWFHGNACPWQFAVPLKGFGCHISCFPSVTRIHHLRQQFCPSWPVVPLNARVAGRNVPSPCVGRRFSSWCLTVWKKATAVAHVFDSCTTNQQINKKRPKLARWKWRVHWVHIQMKEASSISTLIKHWLLILRGSSGEHI